MLLQVFSIPNGMEQMGTGEGPNTGRGRALLNALKKMCPDEETLNAMSGNLYGKPVAELTEDELQKMAKEIDRLRGDRA